MRWRGKSYFGISKSNSDDHYICYCGQESLRRNGVALIVNKRVQNSVLGCNFRNGRMISVHFQDKPFNITVIQAYVPTNNAEEAEVERFYEDLQDLLELTPKKMFFCLATLFLFFRSLKLFFDSSHILFSLLGMPLGFSSFCLANSYSFFMLNITFSDFSSINFHNLNSISLFTLLFFSYNIDTNINTHLCTFLLSIHLCQ